MVGVNATILEANAALRVGLAACVTESITNFTQASDRTVRH
jgi:hypothetical protein